MPCGVAVTRPTVMTATKSVSLHDGGGTRVATRVGDAAGRGSVDAAPPKRAGRRALGGVSTQSVCAARCTPLPPGRLAFDASDDGAPLPAAAAEAAMARASVRGGHAARPRRTA